MYYDSEKAEKYPVDCFQKRVNVCSEEHIEPEGYFGFSTAAQCNLVSVEQQ